jgi:hypothetical protein
MSLEDFAEIDAIVCDMDERDDERFKFLGECLAESVKRIAGR